MRTRSRRAICCSSCGAFARIASRRSNTAFDGDTLTLRIGVLTPDSLRCEESLLLSVPRGGSAAVARETQTVYRRNVVLADSGRYVFTVVPQRTVRGIEAVGLFPVRKRP